MNLEASSQDFNKVKKWIEEVQRLYISMGINKEGSCIED